ncbi:hypothetical protein IAE22_30740, partial [Bacillus sp. S34]|nr:hypothetical protein [Bacillus sp. S34]
MKTMLTTAARNHTAPVAAAQRDARCCTLDIAPWSFFCAGSANAPTTRSPIVSAAIVSCTTRATGRPYSTRLPADTSCWFAVNACRELAADDPEEYDRMVRRTGLQAQEITDWEHAAESMEIPFDPHRGIHPQDAQFLDKELWDLDNTPES